MVHILKVDGKVIMVPGACLGTGLRTSAKIDGSLDYRALKDYFNSMSMGDANLLPSVAKGIGYVDVDEMERKKSKTLITTGHYETVLGPSTRQFI